jgi:pyruvate formate lyase activating enzyme
MKGYIHSIESFGSVDGPGIRFIIFMKGCAMRCRYCHNPDTWGCPGAEEREAEDLIEQALRYKSYWGKKGGITISGGEPLLQMDFLLELCSVAKAKGIHIALDTAGTTNIDETTLNLLDLTDMVLLDVKHLDDTAHKKLTGLTNERTLDFLNVLRDKNIRTWVRWVVVPNINDSVEYGEKIASFIKQYPNVELVELLPYHRSGVFKWKELGIEYPLENVPEPTKGAIKELAGILEDKGIKTLYAK